MDELLSKEEYINSFQSEEKHPVCVEALDYLLSIPSDRIGEHVEAMRMGVLVGSKRSEVCLKTLLDFVDRKPISGEEFLGLCFMIKLVEERAVQELYEETFKDVSNN